MPISERRRKFEMLFDYRSRREMAGSLHMMRSMMRDLGFERRDVNMVWYLSRNSPETLERTLTGEFDELETLASEAASKTYLDKETLLGLLQDMAGRISTGRCSTSTPSGKAWKPVKAEQGTLAFRRDVQSENARYMMLETESGRTTSVMSEHPWNDSLPMMLTSSGRISPPETEQGTRTTS